VPLSGSGGLAHVMVKALAEATPSAGGVLVPEDVSAEIITLVRQRVAVMGMGVRVVPVEKELMLPQVSTGSAAYYIAENARIPVSEPTFAEGPTLRPIELAALVPVSNRILRDAQTIPAFEDVIRQDMADALAGRQDLALLQGIGGGTEPLGVRNHTGLTPAPDLGANGAQPELAHFQRIVGAVRSKNAPFANPGWIFHPDVLTYLETLTDSTGRPLLDTDLLQIDASGGGGRFLGFRFRTTGRIPTNLTTGTSNDTTYAIFGSDWQEAWVGENLDLVIEASDAATYSSDGGVTHVSAWQQRQTVFRAVSAHDFALRRPEFFVVSEGIRL
jgi:HK97 family phage major capsid protein